MTVLSTTRDPAKAKDLDDVGVDRVIIDGGSVARAVRQLYPDGADSALELVGTPTLRADPRRGCFAGMLSNRWTVEEFYPIDYIPRDVRLAAYRGGAADLPEAIL
jgi:hypothetical protein